MNSSCERGEHLWLQHEPRTRRCQLCPRAEFLCPVPTSPVTYEWTEIQSSPKKADHDTNRA
jgi:hypothetical protein